LGPVSPLWLEVEIGPKCFLYGSLGLLRAKSVDRLLKLMFGALPDVDEQFFRLRVISNADQVFVGRAGKTLPRPSLASPDGPNRAVVVGSYFHRGCVA